MIRLEDESTHLPLDSTDTRCGQRFLVKRRAKKRSEKLFSTLD